MEQWGSDFSLDMNVSEDNAISQIATAFTRPNSFGSYEAHLISVRNNQQVRHEFCEGGQNVTTWGTEEYWENIDEDEGKRLNTLIRERVNTILEERKTAEEKAVKIKKSKEIKDKEIYERQQLEALKQKYEGTK